MTTNIDLASWGQTLIAMMLCLGTGVGVYTAMNTKVTTLENTVAFRGEIIAELRNEMNYIKTKSNTMDTELSALSINQNNVISVVGRLNTTLSRLNTSVTKLETKLELGSRYNGAQL